MQNVIHVEAHSTILEYLQASPCHWDRESRDIFQISPIYWKTIFLFSFMIRIWWEMVLTVFCYLNEKSFYQFSGVEK